MLWGSAQSDLNSASEGDDEAKNESSSNALGESWMRDSMPIVLEVSPEDCGIVKRERPLLERRNTTMCRIVSRFLYASIERTKFDWRLRHGCCSSSLAVGEKQDADKEVYSCREA